MDEPSAAKVLPGLAAACENGRASFEDLIAAYDGLEHHNEIKRAAYGLLYHNVLKAFEATHGQVTMVYSAKSVNASVAVSVPAKPTWWPTIWPVFWRRPEFHFDYDLAAAPIGGGAFSRIEQLAVEAGRLLRLTQLRERAQSGVAGTPLKLLASTSPRSRSPAT